MARWMVVGRLLDLLMNAYADMRFQRHELGIDWGAEKDNLSRSSVL